VYIPLAREKPPLTSRKFLKLADNVATPVHFPDDEEDKDEGVDLKPLCDIYLWFRHVSDHLRRSPRDP
jgi:hypothetical protein